MFVGRRARNRSRRGEAGQASLEMIGIIPLFFLVLGVIIQLCLVGYAGVAAEGSARTAAREYSRGASSLTAEQRALRDVPGIFQGNVKLSFGNASKSFREPSVSTGYVNDAVTAEATMEVPFLGFGIDGLNIEVTRFAVMPRTN